MFDRVVKTPLCIAIFCNCWFKFFGSIRITAGQATTLRVFFSGNVIDKNLHVEGEAAWNLLKVT